jgi:flagellar protein FlaJ
MSAVAGSGTPPINIFKLILESEDYKELGGEIKEILNYVNLFGYNLSTALRSVAAVTPSPRFKELLNGMVSTVETGGNLKNFLNQKAEESLNTYRLERKKYVETLSTYSDVYTGVLIAAPLLFVVTLAIINVIGGSIGGLSVDFLAKVGVFGVIPFMNVAFLLVLDVMQPKE